jgi:hypothetical protein
LELDLSLVTRRIEYASADGMSSCDFSIQGDTVNSNWVSQWFDVELSIVESSEILSIRIDSLNGAASISTY